MNKIKNRPGLPAIFMRFRRICGFVCFVYSIIIIIIIIIIYSLEFFTSVWADGLSLEFEWQ